MNGDADSLRRSARTAPPQTAPNFPLQRLSYEIRMAAANAVKLQHRRKRTFDDAIKIIAVQPGD